MTRMRSVPSSGVAASAESMTFQLSGTQESASVRVLASVTGVSGSVLPSSSGAEDEDDLPPAGDGRRSA